MIIGVFLSIILELCSGFCQNAAGFLGVPSSAFFPIIPQQFPLFNKLNFVHVENFFAHGHLVPSPFCSFAEMALVPSGGSVGFLGMCAFCGPL